MRIFPNRFETSKPRGHPVLFLSEAPHSDATCRAALPHACGVPWVEYGFPCREYYRGRALRSPGAGAARIPARPALSAPRRRLPSGTRLSTKSSWSLIQERTRLTTRRGGARRQLQFDPPKGSKSSDRRPSPPAERAPDRQSARMPCFLFHWRRARSSRSREVVDIGSTRAAVSYSRRMGHRLHTGTCRHFSPVLGLPRNPEFRHLERDRQQRFDHRRVWRPCAECIGSFALSSPDRNAASRSAPLSLRRNRPQGYAQRGDPALPPRRRPYASAATATGCVNTRTCCDPPRTNLLDDSAAGCANRVVSHR